MAGKRIDPGCLKASVAMELFQSGILVQDDVMDQDGERRGVPTIHMRYPNLHLGEALATCVGDSAYGWTFAEIAALPYEPSVTVKAIQLFAHYFGRLGIGQSLDVMGGMGELLPPETIIKVIHLKSAEYTCILPLMLGATIAAAPPEFLVAIEKYGSNLGWAFQIQDDILGMFGQETGKPVGSDLRGRKQTLLFNEFLARANSTDKSKFLSLWGKKEVAESEIKWVQEVLESSGSLAAVKQRGQQYVSAGKQFISQLTTDKKLQAVAHDFLDLMLNRMV